MPASRPARVDARFAEDQLPPEREKCTQINADYFKR